MSLEGRGWGERWVPWKEKGRSCELRREILFLKLEKGSGFLGRGIEERWTPGLKSCENQLKLATPRREGKTYRSLLLRCSWGGQGTSLSEKPSGCKLGSPCAQGTKVLSKGIGWYKTSRTFPMAWDVGQKRTHRNIKLTTNPVGWGAEYIWFNQIKWVRHFFHLLLWNKIHSSRSHS